MNNQKRMIIKIIIILVLVVAVGFAVYLKEKRGTTDQGQETLSTAGSSEIPRLGACRNTHSHKIL